MAQTVAADSLRSGSDEPVIHITDLYKRYGRNGIRAVNAVSCRVNKGEIFGLIGPDGAGKTSIVQILAGVLRADSGQVWVSGVDVLRTPENVKGRVGYMPQGLGLNLYDSLTVEENIAFFRGLRQVPAARFRENRDRLLAMTRLAPFLQRPAGQLSGGMRQKLALICTLMHLPDLLLLDEPTTGVDPISRRDFWTIIHELVAGRAVTVFLTTAYMDEAERCHRVALIHEGVIVAEGEPETLMRSLPGQLVAVSGAMPEQVRQAVQEWPGVESVALFGREVHVLLRDGPMEIAAGLETVGVHGANVSAIPASLEDVFVHRLLQRGATRAVDTAAPTTGKPAEVVRVVATDAAAVAVHDLTCRFGSFVAVDSVTLAMHAGEIFGLLGPNGAGKTTLIKMLCGLQKPSEGSAVVAGFDIRRQRDALRGHIGYMSQRFSLYRDLSVLGNLSLYAGLYGLSRTTRQRRIEVFLQRLGLHPFAERLTESLPLGVRQRLALACALLHEPGVLFLDEPTSGVDPLARRQFWDTVHGLARQGGVTVLVSTHYMDEAEHCDRLGFMQHGRLIAVGAPQELKAQAEQRAGPMVVVDAAEFARAFQLLRAAFPHAMLYGRRIRWQSTQPADDMQRARELLAAEHLSAGVTEHPLSIEDAFVSFLEGANA